MPDDKDQKDQQVFNELGVSDTAIWSMTGEDAEKEKALQGLEGIKTWDEMRKADHTGAAIIAGLTLPIRRSSWNVEPASSKDADQEAADFLEQCMGDMSHSWNALVVDAVTFFPFGWSYLEQVMKKRQGPNPPGDASTSSYEDGRMGWRKIVLRPQNSLSYWKVDEAGGIQAFMQAVPGKQDPVPIPIQRSLLFRTTTEGNRPEGVSIFRPAWRPWKHRQRLEMVEGMAFTRNLAGILKARLGPGATTIADAGNDSDEYKAQQLIKDAYNDRLLGVLETDRVQASVMEGPKGTQFEDIGKAIVRKDHEMARATLAHFIILALQERGSYALAKDESDLFLMAVMAYLEGMAEIINRFAVSRLFQLNVFPGITEYPTISPTPVYKPDLKETAEAINNLTKAQVLTIDDGLEKYIRSLAGWPELPVDLTREERARLAPTEEPAAKVATPQTGPEAQEAQEEGEFATFAGRRNLQKQYLQSTQRYSDDLVGIYGQWSDGTAKDLSRLGPEATEEELRSKLDDYLLVVLLLLKEKGYSDLLAAYVLGFGSPSVGPEGLRLIEAAQQKNDQYLVGSLFQDIRAKLDGEIAAILLLLKYGSPQDVQDHLLAVLNSMAYRLPAFAGTYWESIYQGVGQKLTERGTTEGPQVRRVLDPLARHCETCPPKARVYASWDAMVAEAGAPGDGSDRCDGRCRCGVEYLAEDGTWLWA